MLSKALRKLNPSKKTSAELDSGNSNNAAANTTPSAAESTSATTKPKQTAEKSDSNMASFNKILIIGATSGLGREFVRRYHALGKKIIATGRRVDRLEALKKELSGIETVQMDVTDLKNFAKQIEKLVAAHSDLDAVFMMAGIMEQYFLSDKSSTSLDRTVNEVTSNLTAPIVLAQTLVPLFNQLPHPTSLVLTSSGLGFQPSPLYPVYCPTKAAIHYFCVNLRSQLAMGGSKLNIIELNPPYVDTELDLSSREAVGKMLGDHAPQPMALDKYMDSAIAGLDQRGPDGKPLKEVSFDFSEQGAAAWRKAYQPWLDMIQAQG